MHDRFSDRAGFLTIYIKEARPEDEWQMNVNEDESVCYKQPVTLGQRVAIARDFIERFEYGLPLVVDPMENTAEEAYAGWPERLYVIDESGHVAYKGGVGPMAFDPEELEGWLEQRFAAGG